MSFKKLILLFTLILSYNLSFGTHIIGGDFTVQHVSDNTFEVTLTLFRDCGTGGADLDNEIHVSVYEEVSNIPRPELEFNMELNDAVLVPLGDECFTPDICLEIGTYITIVTLPDFESGYYFAWERCCRNPSITNIEFPENVGMVFLVTVANPFIQNSTPVFQSYPTDGYLCVNGINEIDFSATDIDGDSLVYRLETPLQGELSGTGEIGSGVPAPNAGGPKPHLECNWQSPYDLTDICGGIPPMGIDSETGILTANPEVVGGPFVFAIAVDEYREGVLISTIRREILLESKICLIPEAPEFVDFTPVDTTQVAIISENIVTINITVPDGDIITDIISEILSEEFQPQALVEIIGAGSNSNTIHLRWDSIPCEYLGNNYLVQITAGSDNNCLDSALINSMDLYLQIVDPNDLCLTDVIEEEGDYELTIYPNPFQDIINIVTPRPIAFVQILNSRGVVIKEKHSLVLEEKMQFDFKNLPSGLYLIKSFDENGLFSVRRVIKK